MRDAILALEGAYPEGWTNTADAFQIARTNVFSDRRADAVQMAIIITDGIPTRNEARAIPEAENLRNNGVQVFAIGITEFIDEATLKAFSSQPQQLHLNYFSTPSFSELRTILQDVIRSTCRPAPTPAPGDYMFICWRKVANR